LNPNAVKAMKEVGIDISNQTSEIIDTDVLNHANMAITLCGDAVDSCPITPPQVKREHWGFDDPAKVEGTDEEKWASFQRVRDEIGVRIRRFVETEDTCDHRHRGGLDYLKEDLKSHKTKEIEMCQAIARSCGKIG